jgi:hypothetical protein
LRLSRIGRAKCFSDGNSAEYPVTTDAVPFVTASYEVLNEKRLFLPQRSFQRAVFAERLGPADVVFEVRARFDWVEDAVVDAFVGHQRGRFE